MINIKKSFCKYITLPLCRGAVGVFYRPSRLGNSQFVLNRHNIYILDSSRGVVVNEIEIDIVVSEFESKFR